ncbi:MAG TPA: transcriptional regulator [Brevundimonas sp.]|nr:transcriptional regulator [Brevundimonas sp.]
MAAGVFRFERFSLDPADRQLRRDGATVELNARYFDALSLMVAEHGKLVSKDRFLEEVWRGVPVTDEALTQCIRTLRRQLGDDAGRPRFIETVPKHGYRFIAPVSHDEAASPIEPSGGVRPEGAVGRSAPLSRLGVAGMTGGAMAGLIGGLFYGVVGALQPLGMGMGGLSVLLVLLCLTALLALVGGAGVGFGIAVTVGPGGRPGALSIVGGAVGGLIVGAVVKLVGLDAFDLLFGHAPRDMTGAPEGALLGGAIGAAVWFNSRLAAAPIRRCVAAGAVAGLLAGVVIPLLGGRLMGGSLDLLAQGFPASRFRVAQIGAMFNESGFGLISQLVTAGLEAMLFGGCVAGAIALACRQLGPAPLDPSRNLSGRLPA